MRLAAITDYEDGDLLVIRIGRNDGFGEAWEIMQTAKSIANASGINPSFVALPRGVTVEHRREVLCRWAATKGLGIRCAMNSGAPEYSVGRGDVGILGVSNTMLGALELAMEAYDERS